MPPSWCRGRARQPASEPCCSLTASVRFQSAPSGRPGRVSEELHGRHGHHGPHPALVGMVPAGPLGPSGRSDPGWKPARRYRYRLGTETPSLQTLGGRVAGTCRAVPRGHTPPSCRDACCGGRSASSTARRPPRARPRPGADQLPAHFTRGHRGRALSPQPGGRPQGPAGGAHLAEGRAPARAGGPENCDIRELQVILMSHEGEDMDGERGQ